MELHTLGVDGGYTQRDVTELARILTGWTMRPQRGRAAPLPGRHERRERPAAIRSSASIRRATTTAARPGWATPSRRAARPKASSRWTCSRATRPPPGTSRSSSRAASSPTSRRRALVDRLSRRFLDTDGDLRAVMQALVDSPEFRDPRAGQVQDALPVRAVVGARHRHRHDQRQAADGPARAAGPAAVRLPDARRLARHRGRLAQPERDHAARELRHRARVGPAAAATRRRSAGAGSRARA